MANLSQQRRQRMLDFLQKVREKNKDDDDALVAIGEIENEITEKKYGLVWEEHSEEVEERMVEEVPVFTEVHDKEIALTDDGYNFLLEGDNLHSLHLLEKTHKEKIDVIYIDPPYNTGNSFTYDDKIVGDDDAFKHSKWISFMNERLKIAKNLLSENGIIFISIDDHEQSNLRMLCDGIFGADNFIDQLIWQKTENIKMDSKFLSQNKDFVLIYRKSDSVTDFNKQKSDLDRFKLEDEKSKYYLRKLDSLSSSYSRGMDYIIEHDGISYYPGGGKAQYEKRQSEPPKKKAPTWLWSKAKVEEGIRDGEIVFKNGNVYNKVRYDGLEKKPYINIQKIVSQQTAQKELDKMFGARVFDHPKPPQLIKFLISLVKAENNVVLDFFAGSGTTGQAVLELNKEDGGNRKFILCTNNENNICDGVTYPRLQTVITGVRQDGNKYSDGIPANLKYYKTDYIPKKSDNLSADLIKHIDEMIQLEYHVKIDKDKYISVLTDEDADELEKNWQNFPNIRAIYISRSVLLTGKQRELFETKDCFVIPDYYFREELRDAGEA